MIEQTRITICRARLYFSKKKYKFKFLNKKYNKPLSFFLIKYLKKKNISVVVDHYNSISTIKRLHLTKNFFRKKVLLLDRDGTINVRLNKGEYVKNIKQFKFLNKTIKLLKTLSQKKI